MCYDTTGNLKQKQANSYVGSDSTCSWLLPDCFLQASLFVQAGFSLSLGEDRFNSRMLDKEKNKQVIFNEQQLEKISHDETSQTNVF